MDIDAASDSGGGNAVAEQALRQVQARAQQRTRTTHGDGTVRLILTLNRAVYRIARHWLLVVNSILIVYFGQLILAPLLVADGRSSLAKPLYSLNGLFCHQDPDRSFFVFGQKMACCQRCAAIYGGLCVCGLLFVACRRWLTMPAWPIAALLVTPMLIDGLTQAAGWHQSNAVLRVLTGALFAVAVCWLLFPYLERGFTGMRTRIEERFARLVAEGRAQPL